MIKLKLMPKSCLIIFLTLVLLVSNSCQDDSCPAEFELSDPIDLDEETTSNIPYDTIMSMTFIDETFEEKEFHRVSAMGWEEEVTASYFECEEEGMLTRVFYVRPRKEFVYASSVGDSLIIKYRASQVVNVRELERTPIDRVFKDDRMNIITYDASCEERIETEYPTSLPLGGVTFTVNFTPFMRHGVTHNLIIQYPIVETNRVFSLTKGIVGFSHCDKDYIRID